jgi:hypothetical protein
LFPRTAVSVFFGPNPECRDAGILEEPTDYTFDVCPDPTDCTTGIVVGTLNAIIDTVGWTGVVELTADLTP